MPAKPKPILTKTDFPLPAEKKALSEGLLRERKINLEYNAGVTKLQVFFGAAMSWLKRNALDLPNLVNQILGQGVLSLLNFNWNASDAQIDAQIQGQYEAMFENAGEALGFFACSKLALGGAKMLIPKVGDSVYKLASEEMNEEQREELYGLLNQVLMSQTQVIGSLIYKNIRAWIKSPEIAGLLPGGMQSALKSWGNGEPWTIYQEIEERIEQIPYPFNLFAEGAFEGCIEGYSSAIALISVSLRDVLNQRKLPQKTIELKIDKNSDEPPLLFTAPAAEAIQAAENTANLAKFLIGREAAYEAQIPQLPAGFAEEREFWVKVRFRNQEKPPWTRNGEKAQSWEYFIPNPKLPISWADTKEATRFLRANYFGAHRATLTFTNRRQIQIFGATEEEAQERAEDLAKLSSGEIQFISVSRSRWRKNDGVLSAVSPSRCYPTEIFLYKKKYINFISTDPADNRNVRTETRTGRRFIVQEQMAQLWLEEQPDSSFSQFPLF